MSFASDELSDRIRDTLDPRLPVTEQKMFGGRAFMLAGNMLVAVMKEGSLLVRVGKENQEQYLSETGATLMRMGDRTMTGFLEVSGDVLEDEDTLTHWIGAALAFVRTLPPK